MSEKIYNCDCFRCGKKFESTDKDDTTGDGKCPACVKASAAIAVEVDARIRANRANRANNPALPRIDEFIPTAAQGNSGFMGIRERIVNQ